MMTTGQSLLQQLDMWFTVIELIIVRLGLLALLTLGFATIIRCELDRQRQLRKAPVRVIVFVIRKER